METSISESKHKGFNFRDDYRAASMAEASMIQSEISEEAYKNMPTYDNVPTLSLDDLYSTSREARLAQMEAQWQEMDKQFESAIPAIEDANRLIAEEQFERFNNLDAMLQDLEGNDKCK